MVFTVINGLQFMNPRMMVKKGGKCPPGNINEWFLEASGLKEHVLKKLPKPIASKIKFDQTTFGRYPENLLISRRRFNKAYAVCPCSVQLQALACLHGLICFALGNCMYAYHIRGVNDQPHIVSILML